MRKRETRGKRKNEREMEKERRRKREGERERYKERYTHLRFIRLRRETPRVSLYRDVDYGLIAQNLQALHPRRTRVISTTKKHHLITQLFRAEFS